MPGDEDRTRLTTRRVLRGHYRVNGLANGGDDAMNATIPNDDHILRLACAEFEQRHKVVLRLMALKHDTDGEMIRLVSAMEHRRAAIDAIQALPATTIEGHRAKAKVALDVLRPATAAEHDLDDEFIPAVLRDFVGSAS